MESGGVCDAMVQSPGGNPFLFIGAIVGSVWFITRSIHNQNKVRSDAYERMRESRDKAEWNHRNAQQDYRSSSAFAEIVSKHLEDVKAESVEHLKTYTETMSVNKKLLEDCRKRFATVNCENGKMRIHINTIYSDLAKVEDLKGIHNLKIKMATVRYD